mmetsp:Transcript_4370/g.7547  ORF Transcript_4370/g.7547 Transcript_4370/m.7547 type:complete len:259 (-) Transcript_4370:565-1341(-)
MSPKGSLVNASSPLTFVSSTALAILVSSLVDLLTTWEEERELIWKAPAAAVAAKLVTQARKSSRQPDSFWEVMLLVDILASCWSSSIPVVPASMFFLNSFSFTRSSERLSAFLTLTLQYILCEGHVLLLRTDADDAFCSRWRSAVLSLFTSLCTEAWMPSTPSGGGAEAGTKASSPLKVASCWCWSWCPAGGGKLAGGVLKRLIWLFMGLFSIKSTPKGSIVNKSLNWSGTTSSGNREDCCCCWWCCCWWWWWWCWPG